MEPCTRCPPIRSPQGGEWHKKKEKERGEIGEKRLCYKKVAEDKEEGVT